MHLSWAASPRLRRPPPNSASLTSFLRAPTPTAERSLQVRPAGLSRGQRAQRPARVSLSIEGIKGCACERSVCVWWVRSGAAAGACCTEGSAVRPPRCRAAALRLLATPAVMEVEDGHLLELAVRLPASMPLRPPELECRRKASRLRRGREAGAAPAACVSQLALCCGAHQRCLCCCCCCCSQPPAAAPFSPHCPAPLALRRWACLRAACASGCSPSRRSCACRWAGQGR